MLNRLQILHKAFNWPHSHFYAAQEIGCRITDLLDHTAKEKGIGSHYWQGQWHAKYNITMARAGYNFPLYRGNLDFWSGFADYLTYHMNLTAY